MRAYAADEIRNVAIVGHGSAGKTTLADAILWSGRVTQRRTSVDDETSAFDYEPEEHKRRTTISAAVGHVEWLRTKINLVDTAGQGSFIVDTQMALDVADAAVVVVSAADGVQVGTERAWAMLDERSLPRCVLLGKMDRERADFASALAAVRGALTGQAIPIQVPIGEGPAFEGVIDLLHMKALRVTDDGRETKAEEIPAALAAEALAARDRLDEAIAATDDALLEKYLEAGALQDAERSAGLVRAVRARKIVPVLVGSPTLGIGVAPLLDLIATVLPSPLLRGAWKGQRFPSHEAAELVADPDGPTIAWVWKTVNADIGRLSYLRVLSGRLFADMNLLSMNHDKREHVGQLYSLQGKGRETVSEARLGDLVAVAKLKLTRTGDTLADERAAFIARPPEIPPPVISFAIRPRTKSDEDKLGVRLGELTDSDIGLRVTHDPQSRDVLIGGAGQIHVEVAVERLHRSGVDVELLPPHVPYLETAHGRARSVEGKHKKQTGGKGQYGVVYIDLEPLPHGAGFEFEDAVVGGSVPRHFIPAVEKGIRHRMQQGVIAGFPVTDVRVRLLDGKFHDVDSDARSFEIAGSKAFFAAFKAAHPVLLEPIMHLEVVCPEESMGEVIGDLNHRRGRVEGIEVRGHEQLLKAHVPMAETLRYASDLRALTSGRGTFTIELSHYDELPAHLAEKVRSSARLAHEEED